MNSNKMNSKMQTLITHFKACPIVPVLTIDDASLAAPLAQSLLKAGLTTAEITLRTPQALAAITAMKKAAPNLSIGAGTIISENDVDACIKAGADFLVTPAMSSRLLPAIKSVTCPVFPGVATASEALEMYENGFNYVKFFPAEANGGVAAIKSLSAPLPQITFMPTGGINGQTAPDYLALANVIAVGGSWMIDKDALANQDFDKITKTAKLAVNALSK